jgi:hypothetical protein
MSMNDEGEVEELVRCTVDAECLLRLTDGDSQDRLRLWCVRLMSLETHTSNRDWAVVEVQDKS